MKTSNIVINDLLGYPGLKICQRPDMFNFSLDSTILAYFVTINKSCKRIIDLGCGNGYIPIFLTLRTNAEIYGVEIQKDAYDLAMMSLKENKLEDRIHLYHDDLKKIHEKVGICNFDVVVSNPPYFIYKEESIINESPYKVIARHEKLVNLEEVIKETKILLKDGGIFGMVHRAERLIDIITTLRTNGFEPKKLKFIYPKTTSKEALAIYIESIKSNRKGGLKVLEPLYVEDEQGNYTKDVLKIFNYKER